MGPDLRASADLVRRATLSSLRRAEELRLHSVAFPAFGTGVGRMEPKDAADAMVSAFRAHFAAVTESSLRRVYLVLFQEDTYQAFGSLLGVAGARRAS
jgi:O-acetyl-ADP-ribose deacetylase (regulator of RNase III)